MAEHVTLYPSTIHRREHLVMFHDLQCTTTCYLAELVTLYPSVIHRHNHSVMGHDLQCTATSYLAEHVTLYPSVIHRHDHSVMGHNLQRLQYIVRLIMSCCTTAILSMRHFAIFHNL